MEINFLFIIFFEKKILLSLILDYFFLWGLLFNFLVIILPVALSHLRHYRRVGLTRFRLVPAFTQFFCLIFSIESNWLLNKKSLCLRFELRIFKDCLTKNFFTAELGSFHGIVFSLKSSVLNVIGVDKVVS